MEQPNYLQLAIKRGETFEHEFIWLQSDGATPVDITGFLITCDVKSAVNAAGKLFSIPVVTIDGAGGRFKMVLTNESSALIPSTATTLQETDQYWFDIKVNTGNTTEYPIQGDIIMMGAVTL